MSGEVTKRMLSGLSVALQQIPLEERGKILAKAKEETEESMRIEKRFDGLRDVFERQIRTLAERGCPKVILRMLEKQQCEVINKAKEMTIEGENIPFLPVIPARYLTVFTQMAMLKSGYDSGFAPAEAVEIEDQVETPSNPYYIFNVEDGSATLNVMPLDAMNILREAARRGLTAVESIALGLHTDVLDRHWIIAVGSSFKSEPSQPNDAVYLYRQFDGDAPQLYNIHMNVRFGNEKRGVASCSTLLLSEEAQ